MYIKYIGSGAHHGRFCHVHCDSRGMVMGYRGSECCWMVPGTVDPLED